MAAIGPGTVEQAQSFSDSFELKFPLYTDPALCSYRAFELKRKLGIGPTAVWRYLAAFAGGFRQGWIAGDALQQGGTLLIDQTGTVLWQHTSQGPGDQASSATIMEQVEGLVSAGV